MRWLLKTLLFLSVLLAIVILTCDFWGFWLMKGYLMHRGFGCTAERFDIGFWPPRVEIEDLVIRNPKDFPDLRGVRISRFKLVVPYKTLLGQGHRIEEAVLEIPELVIVRAESGELNWNRLKPPSATGKGGTSRPSAPSAGAPPSTPSAGERPAVSSSAKSKKFRWTPSAFFGIKLDVLRLKLGVVEYRDYRVAEGAPPKVITTDLQVDKTYQPVPNLPLVLAGLGFEISLKADPGLKRILEQAAEGRVVHEP